MLFRKMLFRKKLFRNSEFGLKACGEKYSEVSSRVGSKLTSGTDASGKLARGLGDNVNLCNYPIPQKFEVEKI